MSITWEQEILTLLLAIICSCLPTVLQSSWKLPLLKPSRYIHLNCVYFCVSHSNSAYQHDKVLKPQHCHWHYPLTWTLHSVYFVTTIYLKQENTFDSGTLFLVDIIIWKRNCFPPFWIYIQCCMFAYKKDHIPPHSTDMGCLFSI